jgi:glycosyltransferase involved in cell wall biosynthesis
MDKNNVIPKISVVIPVYKVGKYIENSMRSICNQKYRDFEVVLVDNNSPDDSIDIAEKVLKDGKIYYKVVKQTIQGLPAARNKGIEMSSGEWIISIDPDDTISSRFLSDLYDSALSENLNVVFSKYDEVKEDNLFCFPEENKENTVEIYEKQEVLNLLLVRKLPLMVSNMFFNKSWFMANSFSFDEDVILGADLITLWRILIKTERVGFINKYLYNHFFRPDSLMTAPNWCKIKSNLMGYDRLRLYVTENESKLLGDWIYARSIYGFIAPLCIYGDKTTYMGYITLYYNKDVHRILQTFPDRKIRLLDKLLYFSPSITYIINRVLRNPNSFIWKTLSKLIYK